MASVLKLAAATNSWTQQGVLCMICGRGSKCGETAAHHGFACKPATSSFVLRLGQFSFQSCVTLQNPYLMSWIECLSVLLCFVELPSCARQMADCLGCLFQSDATAFVAAMLCSASLLGIEDGPFASVRRDHGLIASVCQEMEFVGLMHVGGQGQKRWGLHAQCLGI